MDNNLKLIELSKIPGIKIFVKTRWLLKHSMSHNMNISDIVIRYLAIENYYHKNNYGFELYKKCKN